MDPRLPRFSLTICSIFRIYASLSQPSPQSNDRNQVTLFPSLRLRLIFLICRYESLVHTPEKVLKKVLQKLHLSFDSRLLSFHESARRVQTNSQSRKFQFTAFNLNIIYLFSFLDNVD